MIATFNKPSARWTAVAVVFLILLAAVTLTEVDARRSAIGREDITKELSPSVQMQFMRPDQLEAAARKFPVVYVSFGLIEWHGRHLPLGNDAHSPWILVGDLSHQQWPYNG
ncbi:MAG: hypothetical protein ACYSUY_10510 [Planctomycetota bacterium]|jgi:hypothetical protein